jgi:hypothetical protein
LSHPRFVDIVDALPLNGAGKIDRSAVQARLNAAYGPSTAPPSSPGLVLDEPAMKAKTVP